MEIDFETAGKPVRRLRKLLKRLPRNPSPEEVHDLRTQTRRLEAMLHAFSPESSSKEARILTVMKPVRRAAGRVRDMDVLIANASSLSSRVQAYGDGIVRLVEHMSEIRAEVAKRLYNIVKRRGKKARSSLKRFLRDLERIQAENSSNVPASPAAAQILAERLEHWPRLDKENLHEFRKGVKELRYMLQLVPDHHEQRVNAFAKVKDTAGDWHDWLELNCVAESVLDGENDADAALLREIRHVQQEKLRAALSTANALRKHGIEMPLAA